MFRAERALAGALNDWSIGEGVAEGNSEIDHACTCFDGSENHIACGGEVGIAAGYVGDQRGLRFEVEGHKSIVDCGGLDEVESRNYYGRRESQTRWSSDFI